jgi:hypothetical protein
MRNRSAPSTRSGVLTKHRRSQDQVVRVAVREWDFPGRRYINEQLRAHTTALDVTSDVFVIINYNGRVQSTNRLARIVSAARPGWWSGVVVVWHAAVNHLVPIAYEDETGFHYGGTLSSKTCCQTFGRSRATPASPKNPGYITLPSCFRRVTGMKYKSGLRKTSGI